MQDPEMYMQLLGPHTRAWWAGDLLARCHSCSCLRGKNCHLSAVDGRGLFQAVRS